MVLNKVRISSVVQLNKLAVRNASQQLEVLTHTTDSQLTSAERIQRALSLVDFARSYYKSNK